MYNQHEIFEIQSKYFDEYNWEVETTDENLVQLLNEFNELATFNGDKNYRIVRESDGKILTATKLNHERNLK